MIFPTLKISRFPFIGTDIHGQPMFGKAIFEMVSPVRLSLSSQHTTVRTDSSASHGNAYESVADVIFMAKPMSVIQIGDRLEVAGQLLRVIKRVICRLPNGRVDNLEFHCEVWR